MRQKRRYAQLYWLLSAIITCNLVVACGAMNRPRSSSGAREFAGTPRPAKAPAIEPRDIPARNLIDLSHFFNTSLDEDIHHKPGNDLRSLPRGVNIFAGVPFDVRGMIQLSGSISKEKTGIDFPSEVSGISINSAASKIHFLQSASWHEEDGARIGEYVVHYADGQKEVIPLQYQVNVVDWWFLPGDKMPRNAAFAWRGDNQRTREQGYSIQLYRFTWANPHPEPPITNIDFVSAGMKSAPFLVAITTE